MRLNKRFKWNKKQLNLLGLLLLLTACSSQIKPIENITSVADDPKSIEKWVLQNSYSLQSSTEKLSLDTLEIQWKS